MGVKNWGARVLYWKLSLAALQIDDEMIGWDLCMGPNLSACSTSLLMGQREDDGTLSTGSMPN
jgi:hypothetical protein